MVKVLYEDEIKLISECLKELVAKSRSKCALLIDSSGQLISGEGDTSDIDSIAISSLAAGNFAATRELAKILGENEFTLLFHEGKQENIHTSVVGSRTILMVIFDNTTPLGRVRLFVKQAHQKLEKIFIVTESESRRQQKPTMEEGFLKATESKLDFGDWDKQ